MAESPAATDMGIGLGIAFGALAILAALAAAATSYEYAFGGDHLMQLLSGVAIAVAMALGGLAIAATHRYG